MPLKKLSFILLTLLSSLGNGYLHAQFNFAHNDIIYSTNDELNSIIDTTAHFTIKEIIIEGNRKTKDKVILRELSFKANEQYPLNELVDQFNETRKQLLNTTLFQTVVVSLKSIQGFDAYVSIVVRERWYVYPVPFMKVVDNNLQQWVTHDDMDLQRVNYGIKLVHKNITGVNDRLRLNFTNGYTKELTLKYEGLPLDKNLLWFGSSSISFGQNRDINYKTVDHKRVSYSNPERFVHSYLYGAAEVSYRPAIKTTHTFGIGYQREQIMDTLWKMNPDFSNQNKAIHYPEAFYRLRYFDVDFIPYPTKGYAAEFLLQRKGVLTDVNLWQLTARTSSTWPLSSKYFFNLNVTGIVKLPFKQPYNMQQFIGSGGMYLQGYENFTIDGVAGGFTKATFTRKILNTAVNIPSRRFKRLNHLPIKVYGKVFGNTGYIYNEADIEGSILNNRLLYSGGVGLDIVLFYDLTFKLEWSWNHLRQNGIYLHDKRYL
jgi:outer membrane protein assembly factor BamA